MAFYPKKRRKVGPSKNDEKVQRSRQAEANAAAAGTLSTRFPGVRGLKVRLKISTPQGAVLMDEENKYGPQDALVIAADCPGSCGSGQYDFVPMIAQALEAGQKTGAAQVVCAESSYSGGAGGCGCVARCEFTAEG